MKSTVVFVLSFPIRECQSCVALGLPANFRERGLLGAGASDALRQIGGRQLVLAGSCSSATRAQIAAVSESWPTRKIDVDALFTHRWEQNTYLDYGLASLDAFGADRCMLGSNFPVDRLYASYDDLFASWEKLLDECTETEAVQLAGVTAAAFYGL